MQVEYVVEWLKTVKLLEKLDCADSVGIDWVYSVGPIFYMPQLL